MTWKLTFRIHRYKPNETPRVDNYDVELEPERTILDGIEQVWALHDRTLTFRHACHHASCGSCAVVVNGVERLPCIVELQAVTSNGGTLEIAPLRNFPVVSDLVVDMEPMFEDIRRTDKPIIGPTDPLPNQADEDFHAYENCIECGMCMSACPVVATDPTYMGPAPLALAQRAADTGTHSLDTILDLVDTEDGIWRCHVAYECSAVCPSNVDPAGKIMWLRRRAMGRRIRRFFGVKQPTD